MINPLIPCILKRCVTLLAALTLSALAGCNTGSDSGASDHHRYDLKVRLVWQEKTDQFEAQKEPDNLDVCRDFGITYIHIGVDDSSGKKVADTALVPCADHTAKIEGIRADKGYTVVAEGVVDGIVLWRGSQNNVEVIAGQNTTPVKVTMTYSGKEQQPLSATIEPGDGATNVPTDAAIRVTFNKEVVAASIHERSITITCGDHPVSGALTYHPKQREVLFEPEKGLTISASCTVTVTTDVMDVTGRPLAKKVVGRFTTPTVWFVDGQSTTSGSGKSWEQAFSTIAEAVAAAEGSHQIWVRQGTYRPEGDILIDKPVELLGGFKGNETQHHQRDWKSHKTVLQGKRELEDLLGFELIADAVIDGFTMSGFEFSAMSIEASPKIENCLFDGNSANSFGGAITIISGDPIIKDCAFYRNNAIGVEIAYGGAIANLDGGPEIFGCVFMGNNVTRSGDYNSSRENECFGGAIYNEDAKSKTSITNCKFIANTAFGMKKSMGGAIANSGEGTVTITGCWFSNNSANGINSASGGAIDNDGDVDIRNSVFYTNHAGSMASTDPNGDSLSFGGGAISLNGSGDTITITNCTFSSNSVKIAPTMDTKISMGGAIANHSESRTTINSSILWGNRSKTDADIYNSERATPLFTLTSSNIDYHYLEQHQTGKYNMSQDPRLSHDMHLLADSPCRKHGGPSTASQKDIDGEARPTDESVDIGADQFIDSDKDSLPDHWEALYNVDNPDSDEDNDGLANLEEYRINTDPNSPQQLRNSHIRGAVAEDGTLKSSDMGTSIGNHTIDSQNNGIIYRAFFVFDVSDAKPVKKASLRLGLANLYCEDYYIWAQIKHVAADTPALTAVAGGPPGKAIFADLGEGPVYSEFSITDSDEKTGMSIHLNQKGVDAINSAITGSGHFIIGLKLTDENYDELVFSKTAKAGIEQLVLIEE